METLTAISIQLPIKTHNKKSHLNYANFKSHEATLSSHYHTLENHCRSFTIRKKDKNQSEFSQVIHEKFLERKEQQQSFPDLLHLLRERKMSLVCSSKDKRSLEMGLTKKIKSLLGNSKKTSSHSLCLSPTKEFKNKAKQSQKEKRLSPIENRNQISKIGKSNPYQMKYHKKLASLSASEKIESEFLHDNYSKKKLKIEECESPKESKKKMKKGKRKEEPTFFMRVNGSSKIQSCQNLKRQYLDIKEKKFSILKFPSSLCLKETKNELTAKGLSPWNNKTICLKEN